ncbi:MAG: hypothetical protein DRJ41_00085 [Thermoprotei archaeon]|nr:MAG: hypothetical protein DRJ41_00085 [Thermoprotei archaeon]
MVMNANRYFLTILVWALILELITLVYYVSRMAYRYYLLIMLVIMLTAMTIGGIITIIRRIKRG